MTEQAIVVKELTRYFGDFLAVDHISFSIEPGVVGYLGPNGSGKTSLLSIVAGYEWPSRGRVAVLGQIYGRCDMRALKERVGWVSSSLFSWLPARQTAREVAATGIHATIGGWHALSDTDLDRAEGALLSIGAHAFRDKRYGVLSQGEKQRVMIARALITSPELLILDEPCAGISST